MVQGRSARLTVMTPTKQGKRWGSRRRKIIEKGIKPCIRSEACQTLLSGSSRDMAQGTAMCRVSPILHEKAREQ